MHRRARLLSVAPGLAVVLLASACGSSPARPPADEPAKAGAVRTGSAAGSASGSARAAGSATATAATATLTATLSSATLEQDCGATAAADPDGKHAKRKSDSDMPPRCIQSEMTLQVRLDGTGAGTLRIARVSLRSSDGAALGTLTARAAARWDEASATFVAWDGALTPGVPVPVRFALTAPPARHATYTLTVVAEAVLADGTVVPAAPAVLEAIAPEPMVKT